MSFSNSRIKLNKSGRGGKDGAEGVKLKAKQAWQGTLQMCKDLSKIRVNAPWHMLAFDKDVCSNFPASVLSLLLSLCASVCR